MLERRRPRSWECKDVEAQKERRGHGKRGGARPAKALVKEGLMERRAARPGRVRSQAVAGKKGRAAGPGAQEREACGGCRAKKAEAG